MLFLRAAALPARNACAHSRATLQLRTTYLALSTLTNDSRAKFKTERPMGDLLQKYLHFRKIITNLDDEDALPKLPQIVVIGGQSTGKSSVLEALVGLDFLPRGTGTVTRRPLELELLPNIKLSKQRWAEFGKFDHEPDKLFAICQICDEINKETERGTKEAEASKSAFNQILGSSEIDTRRCGNMAAKPIRLTISSPYVAPLSLIDLPGVIKNTVTGQSERLPEFTHGLTKQYIQDDNSIIVAISEAISDIQNSDAISLAREIDPNGERTIGVLTKLDMVDDDGVDHVLKVLAGNVIQLTNGFVGVVNRPEKDKNKSIEAARQSEMDFFSNHSKYKQCMAQLGTTHLGKKLQGLLLTKWERYVPVLSARVDMLLQRQLDELAKCVPVDSADDKRQLLLKRVTEFSQTFTSQIEGNTIPSKQDPNSEGGSASELQGGAKIKHLLKEFQKNLTALQHTTADDATIDRAIRQASGVRAHLFPRNSTVKRLTEQHIELLRKPCIAAVDSAHSELTEVLLNSSLGMLNFPVLPVLDRRISKCVKELLAKNHQRVRDLVDDLLDMEREINVEHPDFKMKGNNLAQKFRNEQGVVQFSLQQETFVKTYIRESLNDYLPIVVKNLNDSVPKAIIRFLVDASQREMRDKLVIELCKEELIEEMFAETDAQKAHHKMLDEKLKKYRRIKVEIDELKESLSDL